MICDKWPELVKGEKWKLNNGDIESECKNDFQHSPKVLVVPNAYMYQLAISDDMRMGKYNDEMLICEKWPELVKDEKWKLNKGDVESA